MSPFSFKIYFISHYNLIYIYRYHSNKINIFQPVSRNIRHPTTKTILLLFVQNYDIITRIQTAVLRTVFFYTLAFAGAFFMLKNKGSFMQTTTYPGNGTTTEFYFDFPYFDNKNIIVTINNTLPQNTPLLAHMVGKMQTFHTLAAKSYLTQPQLLWTPSQLPENCRFHEL